MAMTTDYDAIAEGLEARQKAKEEERAKAYRENRVRQEAELAEKRKLVLTRLRRKESNRMAAWAKANKAAIELRDALAEVLKTSETISALIVKLGHKVPGSLLMHEVKASAGLYLSSMLASLPNCKSGLGAVKLFCVDPRLEKTDWADREAAKTRANLKTIERGIENEC